MSSSSFVQRLAVYGSLAPGEPHHCQIADVPGTWRRGWVSGVLHEEGWGATEGYPGIRLEQGGSRVDVHVLESTELGCHWQRLDEFEGREYHRVEIEIHGLDALPARGWIYALR